MRTTTIHLLALLPLLPAVALADAPPEASPVLRRGTELGERIDTRSESSGRPIPWGRATAVIDAPVDVVMATITDYGRYKEFFPHFTQSRVLAQRGQSAILYLEASVLKRSATLWGELKVRSQRPEGATQILKVELVRGNIERFDARWEVTPLPNGRTLVDFRLLVDPDLPIPDGLIGTQNRKGAGKTLAALRKRVTVR
ncbi:MAG: SRPBCC family protein [Myxococcales bacterium]|nr:SRPBCC family protein [Myxococcales bacterium]